MIDLTVNGVHAALEDNDLNLVAEFPDDRPCTHCGEPIAEYDEWLHDSTGVRWCHNLTDDEAAEDDDATRAAPGLTLPANWAGITTEPDQEAVRVEISTNDPRGCFTMTVRRVRQDDGSERVFLSVPHPSDSTPHDRLREIAPGFYEIGA